MMKKLTILILFIIINLKAYTQTWQWVISETQPSYVTMTDIIISDVNGNIIIGGERAYTYNNNGIFIIKYDSNGNKLWENNHIGYDSFESLSSDYTGSIYASFFSPTFQGNSYQQDDLQILAKFDSDGNLLWYKHPGLTFNLPKRTDVNNNLIAAGGFNDTVSLDNGISLVCTASYANMYLAQFNSNGECQWAFADDGGYKTISGKNKGVYTTGTLNRNMILGKGSHRDTLDMADGRTFFAKYDSVGTLLWARQAKTSLIANDFDDNLYTFEWDTSNFFAGFITKYNGNGLFVWQRAQIYTPNWYKLKMTYGKDNCLYFTGGFSNYITIDDTTIYDGGNTRAFVAKFDSSGTLKWITTSSGIGGAGAKDITVGDDGSIYIIGDIGGGQSNFGNCSASQSNGIFVAKLIDEELPLSIVEVKNDDGPELKLFPNPGKGTFQVSYSSKEQGKLLLTISDAKGQQIYTETISDFQGELKKEIDLSRNAKGIYFIQVQNSQGTRTKKIVLE